MALQDTPNKITAVSQGATPSEYSGGFIDRVINNVNLVLRSLRQWVIDDFVSKAELRTLVAEGLGVSANNLFLSWDDLLFPATAVNPPGQASDPVWDNIIPGWLFSSSKTEVLHIVAQLPHTWVEGSELRPHLHWTKTNNGGGNVYWQLEYAWSAIGEVITPFTTLSAPTPISATPDTDTENKQLVTAFSGIDGTGRQISDMLLMRLSRVGGNGADTYGADARLLEYDIHYLRFPLSSVNEYSRT